MSSKLLDEMTFREMWGRMPEDEKQTYLAYQTYKTAVCMEDFEQRLNSVEDGDKRIAGVAGGISGTITSIAFAVINYFFNQRS